MEEKENKIITIIVSLIFIVGLLVIANFVRNISKPKNVLLGELNNIMEKFDGAYIYYDATDEIANEYKYMSSNNVETKLYTLISAIKKVDDKKITKSKDEVIINGKSTRVRKYILVVQEKEIVMYVYGFNNLVLLEIDDMKIYKTNGAYSFKGRTDNSTYDGTINKFINVHIMNYDLTKDYSELFIKVTTKDEIDDSYTLM